MRNFVPRLPSPPTTYEAQLHELRAVDPHFDAICAGYQRLDQRIATYRRTGKDTREVIRLEKVRTAILDTIICLLDDGVDPARLVPLDRVLH